MGNGQNLQRNAFTIKRRASGLCRIKPGDNHEIFNHYRHSGIGGSQSKISSQRQVRQSEGQEKTGVQETS